MHQLLSRRVWCSGTAAMATTKRLGRAGPEKPESIRLTAANRTTCCSANRRDGLVADYRLHGGRAPKRVDPFGRGLDGDGSEYGDFSKWSAAAARARRARLGPGDDAGNRARWQGARSSRGRSSRVRNSSRMSRRSNPPGKDAPRPRAHALERRDSQYAFSFFPNIDSAVLKMITRSNMTLQFSM